MKFEEKKEPAKQDPSSLPDGEKDKQKEELTTREIGRRFYERLKKQGPTLDRVGQSFVQVRRKRSL